jgi:hypothetical protein
LQLAFGIQMLQLFPFLGYLAVITSALLLATLFAQGDMRARTLVLLGALCAAAAWCQFFAASALVSAGGRAVQTVVAVGLLVRWKLL